VVYYFTVEFNLSNLIYDILYITNYSIDIKIVIKIITLKLYIYTNEILNHLITKIYINSNLANTITTTMLFKRSK
jgi:hypothetical protein